jgi:choline-glycine betaine transporter
MRVWSISPSRRSDVALVVSTAIVFLAVAMVSYIEKAFAFALCFSVFMAIAQTKRDSWKDRRFWALLLGIAALHFIAIALIRVPEIKFGLMGLPFALVDGFAIYGLLNWIERQFPAKNESSSE